MKHPIDVPPELVTKAAQIAYDEEQVLLSPSTVAAIVAGVWDDIWGRGFQNGLQTKIEQS